MDNKTKATDFQMIDEAIFRMKSIGYPQSYIDSFSTDNDIQTFVAPKGEPHVYDEWENEIRCSFEDKSGSYVWAIYMHLKLIVRALTQSMYNRPWQGGIDKFRDYSECSSLSPFHHILLHNLRYVNLQIELTPPTNEYSRNYRTIPCSA